MEASLGNGKIWVNTKSTGNIERIFCNAVGLNLLGSIVVNYTMHCRLVIGSSPEPGCLKPVDNGYIELEAESPGIVRIYPFKQTHSFELPGSLQVEETVFVPKLNGDDPPVVLRHISLNNLSSVDIQSYCYN